MVRRISSSRPMTGSSFPLRAASVRSRPYFSSAWNVSSGFCDVTRFEPRNSVKADAMSARDTPTNSCIARSRCSVDKKLSPSVVRSPSARDNASRTPRETLASPPYARGMRAIASESFDCSEPCCTPTLLRTGRTSESACPIIAISTCSWVTSGFDRCFASLTAALNAS